MCSTITPDSRNECCINKKYKSYNPETNECEGSLYEECSSQYENAGDKYNPIVFVIAVIAGLISITMGIILSLPSVSSGLMVGGIFLTIYGTARYWSNLSNWLRTSILAAVLVILIFLGYKKLKN